MCLESWALATALALISPSQQRKRTDCFWSRQKTAAGVYKEMKKEMEWIHATVAQACGRSHAPVEHVSHPEILAPGPDFSAGFSKPKNSFSVNLRRFRTQHLCLQVSLHQMPMLQLEF